MVDENLQPFGNYHGVEIARFAVSDAVEKIARIVMATGDQDIVHETPLSLHRNSASRPHRQAFIRLDI